MKKMGITKKELLMLFERLTARVDMLPQQQKALVRLFLAGQGYKDIAKIASVNEANVSRKLRKIADRINCDSFIAALSENNSMPAEKLEIIKDHFVNGLSARTVAKNTGLSCYEVSKIIHQIKNLSAKRTP